MKKTTAILLLFLSTLFIHNTFGQISVGRDKYEVLREFRKGEYESIKNKTTVFVTDEFNIDIFESMVKQVWTFNTYIVIPREEFEKNKSKYIVENNAIWQMEADTGERRSQTGRSITSLHVFYEYFYPTEIKQKREKLVWETNEIAAVYMNANLMAMARMLYTPKLYNIREDLFNYRLGYIKNYLQFVNTMLQNNTYSYIYKAKYDEPKIKELATKTLYVPDYFQDKTNTWGFKERETVDITKFFAKYTYKYEFISDDAINEKILQGGDEDFYYLMYVRINGKKLLSVVNGKNGDVIYKFYHSQSYFMKDKDLRDLAEKIDDSLKK
jgi:hypothetical protein